MKKLLIIGLVVLAACTGQSTTEECTSDECLMEQAKSKVMVVHDEVMPKLAKISDLKTEIQERLKSSQDSATTNNYMSLLQDLEAADKSMWEWMRAFNSEFENWPLDSAMKYLSEEQAKVDEVAERINNSIAAAEAALN